MVRTQGAIRVWLLVLGPKWAAAKTDHGKSTRTVQVLPVSLLVSNCY